MDSSLCYYCICKRDIQFYSSLDPDCYRNYMLLGRFDCASNFCVNIDFVSAFIIHLDLAYTTASNLRRKV